MFVGLAGCFQTPPPIWLLEDPEILAIRADVIDEGPLSADLGPIPADRVRAEALPGDVVRLRALVAGAQGELAPEDIDIAWFACRDNECLSRLDVAPMRACAELRWGDACLIGRGAEAAFEMPALWVDGTYPGLALEMGYGAVMGRRGGSSTDECVERLRRRPLQSLGDCSLFESRAAIGPRWKVFEILGDLAPPELTGQMLETISALPPNFHPEVERFEVVLGVGDDARVLEALEGDVVDVAPGDRVSLSVTTDPRDTQSYVLGWNTQMQLVQEHVETSFHADVAVSIAEDAWFYTDHLDWTVPSDVPSVRFFFVLDDHSAGVGWGTLTFDVEGAAR